MGKPSWISVCRQMEPGTYSTELWVPVSLWNPFSSGLNQIISTGHCHFHKVANSQDKGISKSLIRQLISFIKYMFPPKQDLVLDHEQVMSQPHCFAITWVFSLLFGRRKTGKENKTEASKVLTDCSCESEVLLQYWFHCPGSIPHTHQRPDSESLEYWPSLQTWHWRDSSWSP